MVKFSKFFGLGICVLGLTIGLGFGRLAAIEQLPQVTAVTPNSLVVQSLKNEPSQLVQLGKESYKAGQFANAIAVWQKVLDLFTQRGERVNQAVVQSNLALAYQQLGQWQEANQAIAKSIILLNEAQKGREKETSLQDLLAEALNIQGSLQLAQGKAENALYTWVQATDTYKQAKDKTGVIRSSINQTQALRVLGRYSRAQKTLEEVNKTLQAEPDSLLKASGLLNLGNILQVNGDLNRSEAVLKQSLGIAQKLQSKDEITLALLSLGNTTHAKQQNKEALNYYQQAIAIATTLKTKIQAQLNQLRLLIETEQWTAAEKLIPQIQPYLQSLPPSRTALAARVNFAQSLIKVRSEGKDYNSRISDAAQILGVALKQAQELEDQRAEAYALFSLGELYAQTQQWLEAGKLTEKSLKIAQESSTPDIISRSSWQLGRIFVAQGKLKEAISAYTEAVKTLEPIRYSVASVRSFESQFFFTQTVIEPVYRELVSLLLQQPSETPRSRGGLQAVSQLNSNVIDVIESLQVAAFDKYFGEACFTGPRVEVDKIDPQAAIIYPIILRDRLEVVLSLPNQTLRHYATDIPQQQLEQIFEQMQASLSRTSLKEERLPVAQKVYELLIRPAEADLEASNIKTLIFVPDEPLKNLPIAALHDGQRYLVEKYNVALTPSLRLLAPSRLQRQQIKVLIGGVSQPNQGYTSLPGVEAEVTEINSEIPSQVLLNQKFTKNAIKKQIRTDSFQVVHLATHGQFSSNAAETFILTWDSRLDVKQLGELLKTREENTAAPIELLVLSACQTAGSDKRASLGLAGVAVRSGARSTLGTLWPVEDQSTAVFMAEFYRQLTNSQITKAQALRQAQLKLLNQPGYQHPFYWAGFVLIGNWL
ncbi:CHAT domain-containing protein [Iningainema sp. BLCCT55]|uniref:CHAT domain-containing protein n=1 Tax=Iningainema tapete BLCC-T55 TaxID=2748662 RepID=A0A8J7C523_9CYAN|nr:CHAT domain-containing protein [Iningainema tapete BLCC-T55]